MNPDSLALISAQVKAALNQTQQVNASGEAQAAKSQVQVFSARVVSVLAKAQGDFEIVLKGLDASSSETFKVQSKQALAVNSELLLKLEEVAQPKVKATGSKQDGTSYQSEAEVDKLNTTDKTLKTAMAQTASKAGEQTLNPQLKLSLIAQSLAQTSAKAAPVASGEGVQSMVGGWLAARLASLFVDKNMGLQQTGANPILPLAQHAGQSLTPNIAQGAVQTAAPLPPNSPQAQRQAAKLEAHYQLGEKPPNIHTTSLKQTLNTLFASLTKLPAGAQKPLQDWLLALPQQTEVIQVPTLKTQLQNAGLFFEHKLNTQMFSLKPQQVKQLTQELLKATATQDGKSNPKPAGQMGRQTAQEGSTHTQGQTAKAGPVTQNQPASSSKPAAMQNQPASSSKPAAEVNPLLQPTSQISSMTKGEAQTQAPVGASSYSAQTSTTTTPPLGQPLPNAPMAAKTLALVQAIWQTLKAPNQTQPLINEEQAETAPTLKQILTLTKEKLEAQATSHLKRSMPNWAAQLHSGDLKVALAQSLIKTLQANMQQGLINGQDAQQAMSGRIPLNVHSSSLLNETQQLLQQALAQVEVEQFQQLNDERPIQHTQLYFRENQQVQQVSIELLEQQSDDDTDSGREQVRQWRIRLHFELQQLGNLGVEISLNPPHAAATFWSEQTHALKALQTEIAPLRARLQQQGVEVGELQVRRGRLPEKSQNTIQQQLIDIHT